MRNADAVQQTQLIIIEFNHRVGGGGGGGVRRDTNISTTTKTMTPSREKAPSDPPLLPFLSDGQQKLENIKKKERKKKQPTTTLGYN